MKEKIGIEKIYSLTPMQEGMLFHSLRDTDSFAYFQQYVFTLRGDIDRSLLEKSFNKIIDRYVIFRTAFNYESTKKPLQIILKKRNLEIYFNDISHLSKRKVKSCIDEFKNNDRKRGFNLAKDVLMRLSLFKTEKNFYTLIWSFHHILMDGWCVGIIIKELLQIYQSLLHGKSLELDPVTPYWEYFKWLSQQDKEEGLLFWKKELEGYDQPVTFLKSNPSPGDTKYKLEEHRFFIDEGLTGALERIARDNQVTMNTVFQTLWGIFLQKYNNCNDVVFGALTSGRPPEIQGVESIIGLFVNAIPVRIKCREDREFARLLRDAREKAQIQISYEYLPLVEIQSDSLLKGDLINQLMGFDNYLVRDDVKKASARIVKDVGFSVEDMETYEQTNYDFNIGIIPGKRYTVRFVYNSYVYDKKELLETAGLHFDNIVRQVVENPAVCIKDIEIITRKEKQRILMDFNNTRRDYPGDKTIIQLFQEQVEKTPDSIAVVFQDMKFTYKDVNERSNRLARVLRRKGVKPDDLTAIMMERSIEMITGVIGIMKAGGAYLPIDPNMPEERINFFLKDARPPILLTKVNAIKGDSLVGLHNLHRETTKTDVKLTGRRAQIKDFDNLPIPNRRYINISGYDSYIGDPMIKNTYITIQATRGCPYHCAYCHKIWPKSHIFRSAENIFEEVQLYYNMGVRRFSFIDDIFNFNIENSKRFFQLILKNGLDVQIFFPSGLRGDRLTKDYIDLMVEAGTVAFALALETASPRVQKVIRKNLNLETFLENARYVCEKYPNVILELFTMHGFPTETEEEAMATLNFIKDLKWTHFAYVNTVKVFPNTDMEILALKHGVRKEEIDASIGMAFHEIPLTSPFDKSFTLQYQFEFFNEYVMSKERLLHVLPSQFKIMTKNEIVQKYNSYLPVEIKSLEALLEFLHIREDELGVKEFLEEDHMLVPDLDQKVKKHFSYEEPEDGALKVLLLDLSQFFTHEADILYDLVEPPLGLLYLMTYLQEQLGSKINGRIAKARIEFDSYKELKDLIKEFAPDVIGIRTLTFYKDFFHRTAALIRQWGFKGLIMSGGPHATSNYRDVLLDRNIDLVVMGEGEITFCEIIEAIAANGGRLPGEAVLDTIPGLAFISKQNQPRKESAIEMIMVDGFLQELSREPVDNLEHINQPDDLVYNIFTSGSTGKPKGVMVKHSNLAAYMNAFNREFNITPGDIVLQQSSFSFDVFVEEVFPVLLKGGQIVIPGENLIKNISLLLEFVAKNSINIIDCSPLLLNELNKLDKIKNVHTFISGGDVLKGEHVDRLLKVGSVYNTYGPTEATVCAAYYKCSEGETGDIIIGKPISNYKIFIMGKNNELLPVYITGELCISGSGVSRGYLNQPELTAEKYFYRSYRSYRTYSSPKIYKTGDLARWLPDGDIEFIGRIDSQVKIRGFRIELGEIESQLLKHNAIKEVVVLAKEDKSENRYLCAYIVSDTKISASELRFSMLKCLPYYMIPSFFVEIDNIPLTPNGKIDRKALPEPGAITGEEYIFPRNEIEAKLVDVWQEVLAKEKIGINENFFTIGGDSIKSIQIAARMNKGGYTFEVADLFRYPHIVELAPRVRKINKLADRSMVTGKTPAPAVTGENALSPDDPVQVKHLRETMGQLKTKIKYPIEDIYNLSPLQEGMLFHALYGSSTSAYFSQVSYRIRGELNTALIEKSLQELFNRHAVLRTVFIYEDVHRPVQVVLEGREMDFYYEDMSGINPLEREKFIKEFKEKDKQRSFDLSQDVLMRVSILQIDIFEYEFIWSHHHILMDGWCAGILILEFFEIYNSGLENRAYRLPGVRPFRAYIEWLEKQDKKESQCFWQQYLAGYREAAGIPGRKNPGKSSNGYDKKHVSRQWQKERAKDLQELAKKHSVTLNTVFQGIWGITLAKYNGRRDVVFGLVVSGRPSSIVGVESMVGLFINTIPVRVRFEETTTFNDLLHKIREEAVNSLSYHYSPLADIQSRGPLKQDLIDHVLVFENLPLPERIDGLMENSKRNNNGVNLEISKVETVEQGNYDLEVIIAAREKLIVRLNYNANVYEKELVEGVLNHFNIVMEQILNHAEILIEEIVLLSEEERKTMLRGIREKKANPLPENKEMEPEDNADFDF